MNHSAPCAALPENARLFFGGVAVRAGAQLAARLAARWNAGEPEWLRPLVEPAAWRTAWRDEAPPVRRWVIDFPPGAAMHPAREDEWARRRFAAAGARISQRGAGAELRIALAKAERFLATPRGRREPDWRWVPARHLPGAGMLVLARDDEFLAAVVASRWFAAWTRRHAGRVDLAPARAFPFPWPPDTLRSALTRSQEEHRSAVVGAARAAGAGRGGAMGDFAAEDLAAAVAAAYGWPPGLDEDGAVERLRALHRQRAVLNRRPGRP